MVSVSFVDALPLAMVGFCSGSVGWRDGTRSQGHWFALLSSSTNWRWVGDGFESWAQGFSRPFVFEYKLRGTVLQRNKYKNKVDNCLKAVSRSRSIGPSSKMAGSCLTIVPNLSATDSRGKKRYRNFTQVVFVYSQLPTHIFQKYSDKAASIQCTQQFNNKRMKKMKIHNNQPLCGDKKW